MEYRIIKPEEYKTMPWKNGKGVTTELFIKNAQATDKYIYRLSMAGVTEDGEFSDFSGYDRTLIMLEGNGIRLHHSDGTMNELRTTSDIALFSGDEETHAELVNGPIKDFNVMTLRERCVSDVKIMSCGKISAAKKELLIYALSDTVIVHKDRKTDLTKNYLLYVSGSENDLEVEGNIISVSIVKIV
ncbi:MAG TPA: HutD family protein [Clostridiales bacterium]|nr:HutD family protein [Clostridiales bacterium]